MSKTTKKRPHRKTSNSKIPERRTSDGAIYFGLLMIGAFAVGAIGLVLGGHWGAIALGYVIALAWLTNLYAVAAYRGKKLANWQQALARLPLRFAGFGTRNGKPLEAAHNADSAKTMIFLSIVVSLALIVVVSFILLPELRSSLGG